MIFHIFLLDSYESCAMCNKPNRTRKESDQFCTNSTIFNFFFAKIRTKTGHPALQSPRRNTLGSNGEWKFDFSACKRIGIAKR